MEYGSTKYFILNEVISEEKDIEENRRQNLGNVKNTQRQNIDKNIINKISPLYQNYIPTVILCVECKSDIKEAHSVLSNPLS